ncbi:MAG TPA: hypothetical protein VN600_10285 [Gemmatimonadaceae bacterium]|nr:hypothetical protein [Gemmatimonadaceae bacterium]
MRVTCVALAVAVAVAACATNHGLPSSTGPRQTVRIDNPTAEIDIDMTSNSDPKVASIAAPIERVWALLPSVYDSLGIPIGHVNSTTRTIGNTGLKIRTRLGKEYLSTYIDCGRSQIGESADSYDVVLTIFTQADSTAGGETRVTTSVDAVARPAAFSQAYSRCTTKYVLEGRVMKLLKARLSS